MGIFSLIKFVLVVPLLFKFLELNCIPVKGQVVDGTKAINARLKNPSLELGRFDLRNESGQRSHDFYYNTDISFTDFILENITSVTEVLGNLSGRNTEKSKLLISIQLSQNSLNDYTEFERISQVTLNNRRVYSLPESHMSKIHKPSIDRISGVAVNWKNVPCSKELTFISEKMSPEHMYWLFKDLNSKVKVGVIYDKSYLGCRFAKRDVEGADFVIFIVEFSQSEFIGSYGIFKRYMNHLSQENEKYVHYMGSSATEIFYLVEFSQNEGENDKNIELESYQKLLLNYSLEWASEEHKTVIVDPFIISKPEASTEESTILPNFKLPTTQFQMPPYLEISILECLETVSKSFKEVFIDLETWMCLSSCWDYHQQQLDKVSIRIGQCFCGDLASWDKINMSVSLYIDMDVDDTLEISELELKFTKNLNLGGITLEKFAFRGDEKPYYNSQSWEVEVSRRLSEMVKIVCVNFDRNRNGKVGEFCEVLLKEKIAKSWISSVYIDMDEVEMNNDEYLYNSNNIIHQLNMLNKEWEMVLEQYPGITFSFKMTPVKPTKVTQEEWEGLYCSENVLRMNEIVEGISNWAIIHKVTLIFGFALQRNNIFGWQRIIYPPYKIVLEEDPLLTVMQNFPKSMDNVGGQPCIQRINVFPKDGIKFNENVGVAVSLNLKSGLLSSHEIGTMLMYAFHKFESIQVQVGNDVKAMENLITALNLLPVESNRVQGKIFIQVELPVDKNSRKVYLEKVEKLVSVLNFVKKSQVGVHVIKLGDQLISQDVGNLLEVRGKVTFQIGLSFPDCVSELNGFHTNSTLKLPKDVNYVICEEKVVVGLSSNKEEMTRLLEEHLVMEKVFKKIAPEVEVTFNIQTFPGNKSDGKESLADLLNFIFDVNEFAGIFQLNYFVCPAFDNNRTGEKGWWRIKSFQDLTNYSTYQETQSEMLNVNPWRPTGSLINAAISANPSHIAKWVIPVIASLGGVLLVIVLIGSIGGIIVKKKLRILSDAEVQEFLQGKKFLASQCRGDSSCLDFSIMKFDQFLEIPKSELHLESAKILGNGNFGMVYQGIVRGENVAVKVPHDGCSKESFKSMLTEVKILCYIGDHVNVIKFVGAYTKEIQKGVIYIATTLCENGALQSYLREKQKQNRDGQVDMDVMARELIVFSKEIASGMAYIASRNVVHGDLSTRNVLLDEHNTCKIADFGLSRKLYENYKYVKKSKEDLPWRWLAFESLKMREFTTKSDVWSYGITLWEVFTLGDVPYPGLSWSLQFVEDIRGGMRMEKPLLASEDIFTKINPCWNLDPKERPTFEELRDFFVSRMNSEYRDLTEV